MAINHLRYFYQSKGEVFVQDNNNSKQVQQTVLSDLKPTATSTQKNSTNNGKQQTSDSTIKKKGKSIDNMINNVNTSSSLNTSSSIKRPSQTSNEKDSKKTHSIITSTPAQAITRKSTASSNRSGIFDDPNMDF